jgi:hypothetical protein
MNRAYKALFAGMLCIVFTGPAIAHHAPTATWSGGLTVAVTPRGELAWGGGLAYGPVFVRPARQAVVVAAPYPGPACGHPAHRHHPVHHRGRGYWKRHHRHHHRHGH